MKLHLKLYSNKSGRKSRMSTSIFENYCYPWLLLLYCIISCIVTVYSQRESIYDRYFSLRESIYHRYFPLSLYEIQLLGIDQSNISILGSYTLTRFFSFYTAMTQTGFKKLNVIKRKTKNKNVLHACWLFVEQKSRIQGSTIWHCDFCFKPQPCSQACF